MSYRCEECNSVHYGKCLSIITDIREVDYIRSKVYFDRITKEFKTAFDEKFKGWETHRKINVCSKCYEEQKDSTPNTKEQKMVNFFIQNKSNKSFKIDDNNRDKRHTNKHNKATNKSKRGYRDNIYEDGKW